MTDGKEGIPTHDDSVPSNLKSWLAELREAWLKAAVDEEEFGEPVPHVGASDADGTHGIIQQALSMRGTTTRYNYRRFLTTDRNLANFEEVDMPTTEEINTSRVDAGGKMSNSDTPAPESPKELVKAVLNDVETTTMERLLAGKDPDDIADLVERLSKNYAKASDESEIEGDYVTAKPNKWNYRPNRSQVATKQRGNFKSSLEALLENPQRLDPRIAHLVFADLDTEYDILPTIDLDVKNHIAALANEDIYTIASMGFDLSVDETTGKIKNDFKREYRYNWILSDDNYRWSAAFQPNWGLSEADSSGQLFTDKATLDNLGRRGKNTDPYTVPDLAKFSPLSTKFNQYKPLYENYRGEVERSEELKHITPIWGPGEDFDVRQYEDEGTTVIPSYMDEYASAFYKARGMHKTGIKWGGQPGVMNSLLRHLLRFAKMRAHVTAGARELVTMKATAYSDLSEVSLWDVLGHDADLWEEHFGPENLSSDLLIDRGGYNTLSDKALENGRRHFPHFKFPTHLGLWAGANGINPATFSNVWLGADPRLAQHRKSLLYLLGVDNEALESRMASTLELSSHRLDAWWSSVANRRLAELRAEEDNWYTRDPPDYQDWKQKTTNYLNENAQEPRPWSDDEVLPVPPGPNDPPSPEPQELPDDFRGQTEAEQGPTEEEREQAENVREAADVREGDIDQGNRYETDYETTTPSDDSAESTVDRGNTITGDYSDADWPDPTLESDNDSGIYVGAWGFVEDLSDDPGGTDPGEYVQTPSLQQATTAAILRGGNQAYEAQDEGHLSGVDLSADRVRLAQQILDGVRDGQPLKAVLGYRFERALQEEDLQQYLIGFREEYPAFPENENRESPQSSPAKVGAKYDVVDGYELYKQIEYASTTEDGVKLTQGGSYDLTTLPDPTVDSQTGNAIEDALLKLLDAVDAVRDLLTAESIHQFSQGNFSRARVSLDAVAADGIVPDLDVVDTPRTETSITHRLSVTFGDLSENGLSNWAYDNVLDHPMLDDVGGNADLSVEKPSDGFPLQVRADAEPNLASWLDDVLPEPKNVGCSAAFEWSASREATTGKFTTPPESNHVSVTNVGFQPDVVLFTTAGAGDFEGRSGEGAGNSDGNREGSNGSPESGRPTNGWTHGAARRSYRGAPKQHSVSVGYDTDGADVTTAVNTDRALDVAVGSTGKQIQCEVLEMTDEGFEIDVTLTGGDRAPSVAVEYVAIRTGDLSGVEIGHFTPAMGGDNATEQLPFDANHAILTTTDGFDAAGFGGGSSTETSSGKVGVSRGEVVADDSGTDQRAVSVVRGGGKNPETTVGAEDGNAVSLPGATASVATLDTTLELAFSSGSGTARPITYVAFDTHSSAQTPELGVAKAGETKLTASFRPGWIEFVAIPGIAKADFTGGGASKTFDAGIGGISHGMATAVHEQTTLSHGAGADPGENEPRRLDGRGSSRQVVSVTTTDADGNETRVSAKLSAVNADGFTLQFTEGSPDDILVLYRAWPKTPAEIDHRATTSLTFHELVMTPLDVLYGSQADRDQALTELERRIGYYLRRERKSKVNGAPGTDRPPIPKDATIDLTLGDPGSAAISGADFLETVRSLRELVTEGRSATADDYVHPAERGGTGYDKATYEELHHRAEDLHGGTPTEITGALENTRDLLANRVELLDTDVDNKGNELPTITEQADEIQAALTAFRSAVELPGTKSAIQRLDDVGSSGTGPNEEVLKDELETELAALVAALPTGPTDTTGADEPIQVEALGSRRIRGTTDASGGGPLKLELRGYSRADVVGPDGTASPLNRTIEPVSIDADGTFDTEIDFHQAAPGTHFTLTAIDDNGDVAYSTDGRVLEPTTGIGLEGAAGQTIEGTADVATKTTLDVSVSNETNPGDGLANVSDSDSVLTDEDGTFSATIDLSGADPGTPLVITATDPDDNEVFDQVGYVRRPPKERDPVAALGDDGVLRMLLWLDREAPEIDPGRPGSAAAELQRKLDGTDIDWSRIDTEVTQLKEWKGSTIKPGWGREISVAIDQSDITELEVLTTLPDSKYSLGSLGSAIESVFELPGTAGVTEILDLVGGHQRPAAARLWGTASDGRKALVRGELAQLLRNPKGVTYTSVEGFAPEFEAFIDELLERGAIDLKNRDERLFAYLEAFFEASGELVRSLRGDLERPDRVFEGLRDAAFYPSRFSGNSGVSVGELRTGLEELQDYFAGAGLDALEKLAESVHEAEKALEQQDIRSQNLEEMDHWVSELQHSWQEATIKGYLQELEGLFSDFKSNTGQNVPQKTQQIKNHLKQVKTELHNKQTWLDVETLDNALADVTADRYLTTGGSLSGGTPATEFVYMLGQLEGHLDEYEQWLTSGSPPRPVFDANAARGTYATQIKKDFSELTGSKSTIEAFIDVDRSTRLNEVFRRCLLETVRIPLLRAGYFGVFASIPTSATGGDANDEDALLGQAEAVLGRLEDRFETAEEHRQMAAARQQEAKRLKRNNATDREVREAYAEAAEAELARLEALFDDEFTVLPPITPPNHTELSNTFERKHRDELLSNADPMEVETWLQRQARVRERPALLRESLTYAELLTGDVLRSDLAVGQLPYRSTDDWAGIDAEDGKPAPPSDGTVSMVTYFASANNGETPIAETPSGQGSRIAGLYVDDWRVAIPSTEETTGIAVNYDDPGMEPPQSMLLAVPPAEDEREGSPDGEKPQPWTDETLIRTILEAIDLAKMRGVDLDAIGTGSEGGEAAESALGHMLPGLLFPQNTKHRPDVPSTKFRLDEDIANYLSPEAVMTLDYADLVENGFTEPSTDDGAGVDNNGDTQ